MARCVAERLGYRSISREVLVRAAENYGCSLEKLSEAIAEVPWFPEGLTREKAYYLASIRATLCREIQKDNIVYHGHAGHLLIRGLPHLIRVRIIASMEYRIQAAMERNRLNRAKAIDYIKKVDEKRVRWTKFLYNVDWHDPSLYDIILNIDHMTISDACEVLVNAASLERFKTTPEAQKMVDDMVLSSEIRAIIASSEGVVGSGIEVEANGGVVTVGGNVISIEDVNKIQDLVTSVPGVKFVNSKVIVKPFW